ncbi:hypothetical protein [Caenispirillum bisanense]|uniref:hypothetical protein n=1 Tax=Caenispirillum bisanense TaxID=414052 RepID=UPI0031D8A88E
MSRITLEALQKVALGMSHLVDPLLLAAFELEEWIERTDDGVALTAAGEQKMFTAAAREETLPWLRL